jgi:hypothetical protein
MAVSGGMVRPLVYGLIAGTAGAIFGAVYGFVLQMALQGSVGLLGRSHLAAGAFQGIFGLFVNIVLAPVGVLIGAFVASAIYHVLLAVLGQAQESFEATFRVVCYSYAAALVAVVPLCGSILAGLWSLALVAIGLSKAHRTSLGFAILVVLLPILLCLCCAGATGALVARAIMSRMS